MHSLTRGAVSGLACGDYHLILNNCQHLTRWCATADQVSEQVDPGAATTGTITTSARAAPVGINVVGSADLVGPPEPSRDHVRAGFVRRYGAWGAVAGLVVFDTAPWLVRVTIMNRTLRAGP